jgi:hypothetical protein
MGCEDSEAEARIRRAKAWVPHPEIAEINEDGVSYACSYCMYLHEEGGLEQAVLDSIARIDGDPTTA